MFYRLHSRFNGGCRVEDEGGDHRNNGTYAQVQESWVPMFATCHWNLASSHQIDFFSPDVTITHMQTQFHLTCPPRIVLQLFFILHF